MSKKIENTAPETAANETSASRDAEAEARAHEDAQAAAEGKNRTHYEGLGDAWAVLTGRNPAPVQHGSGNAAKRTTS